VKLTFHTSATVAAPHALVDRQASWKRHSFPIKYGVLEHPIDGLILVDTGYSDAIARSRDPHIIGYRRILGPQLHAQQEAKAVVMTMGAAVCDVRHILLSHLHADHICGLENFPNAKIHASATSLAGWKNPTDFVSSLKGFFPCLLPRFGERNTSDTANASKFLLPWGGAGFDVMKDGSIIAIDLPGHMKGHVGFYFPKLNEPVLYAADADWTLAGLNDDAPPPWPARLIVDDVSALLASKRTVVTARSMGVPIILSHGDAQ
jgi:glyoxylase-like metal-dependent hydrolase (beta-lactamase superfamily II)